MLEHGTRAPDEDAWTVGDTLRTWWLFGWLISGVVWLAGFRHTTGSTVIGVLWLAVAAGITATWVARRLTWARNSNGAWRTVARSWVLAFAGIFAIGGVYALVLALV